MSKRHQSSRRKSYGRRQHEVHERSSRRDREAFEAPAELEDGLDHLDAEPRFNGYGGHSARLGFALSD